ncbi:MAG TPA: pirin family protein [Stellaceae bacterium]|nr:pirin family protein [Stellaceae bacterium]
MSWLPAKEPSAEAGPSPALELVILPRVRDLGDGFAVRRVLPFTERRALGPFVFFDHFGPTEFRLGEGLDVRPHPHIGLATVTYLLDGEILHRDSLGSVQPIRPGAVNWMTAGRGIVHSERTPPAARAEGARIHGVQLWVGLPRRHEETAPGFSHHPAETLPLIAGKGSRLRLIAGSLMGAQAPVPIFSALFCAEAELAGGAEIELPAEHEERGAYILSGEVELGGEIFPSHRLLVLRPGRAEMLRAAAPARLLLLGGAPLDGPRHIWWNFVASSTERIEQAKADWKAGRFMPVPGESDFIPLPE